MAAAEARADDPPARASYAWQTLTVDATAVAITLIGVGLQSTGGDDKIGAWTSGAGIASYAVLAPIVHLGHGHVGTAAESLALRVIGIPLFVVAGASLGALGSSSNRALGLLYGATAGGGIGVATISIFDARALAHDDDPSPAVTQDVRVVPTVAATPAGGSVGLVGVF